MPFDIGPKIGIEGEVEYKKALKEIEQGQRVMASELQKVSASFAGQESSIEALTAQHDVLQRSLYGERDRIESLRAALDNAANSFGESDKRTQEWQIKLNRAEAEEAKLEKQLVDTSKELKKQGVELETDEKAMADFGAETAETAEKTGGLGDLVGSLSQKFGIQLPGGITQSLNSMSGFSAGTVAAVGAAGSLVAALVKVEGKLLDLSKAQAAEADELVMLATKTGIAAKTLQEYAYASELIDVSVETITGAQTKLIRSMDSARDGAAQQTAAFEKLGIQYQNTDGTLRNSETVFWEVVDALGQIQNGTERDAAAMDLLGKSAQDLNPLITAGSEKMRELATEAEKVGYILSEQDVEALTALDDAQQRAQKSNEALQKQIAVEFAPSATKAIETLTSVTQVFGKALVDSGAVEAFGYILESVTSLISPLGQAEDAGRKLESTFRVVALTFANFADTLQVIVGLLQVVLGAITPGLSTWVGEGFGRIGNGLGFSGDNYTSSLKDSWATLDAQRKAESSGDPTYYNGQFYGNADAALYARWLDEGAGMSFDYWKQQIGRNAAGTDDWRGGLTWVGESGPELADLPRGTKIYSAQESRDLAVQPQPITFIMPGGVREMAQAVELMKAQRTESRRGAKVRR